MQTLIRLHQQSDQVCTESDIQHIVGVMVMVISVLNDPICTQTIMVHVSSSFIN